MNFGDKIKQLRLEKNWTQEFVANKLNISMGALSRYETGMYEPKSLDLVKDFSNLFEVSTDYLLGKSEFKTKDEEMNAYISLYHSSVFSKIIFETTELFNNTPITINDLQRISNIISKCSIENDEDTGKAILEKYLCMYIQKGRTKEEKEKISLALSKFIEKSTNMIYEEIDNIHKKKSTSNLFIIPILGKIAAGQPILAEEYIEGYLPVDPNIYGMTTSDDYFYLRVSGESMNLKVHNGDYALIHKQDYAENGDIIVAIVNGDDEATMKRYKKINDEIIMLEPMSTYPMEPIVINLKETKFQIIGKAIGQFGKF